MTDIDLTFAFIDATGDAANPTTPVIDIRGPDGTLKVNGAALDIVAAEVGIAEYTYTVPSDDDGVYSFYVHDSGGGSTPVHAGHFTVRNAGTLIRPGIHARQNETIRLAIGINDFSGDAVAAPVSAGMVIYGPAEAVEQANQDITSQTGDNTGEFYGTWAIGSTAVGTYRAVYQVDDGSNTPATVINFVIEPTPTVIAVSVITPVGVLANQEIRFSVVSSVAGVSISVILTRQGPAPTTKSASVVLVGSTGTVVFEAGLLPLGTYDVLAVASDGSDSGFDVGTDLVLGIPTDPVQSQYWERIRATLRASAAVVDLLRDTGNATLQAEHPDILIDSLAVLDRMAQFPGVIIEPIPGESEPITFNARQFLLRATVWSVARAQYEGIRNDDDRGAVEAIAAASMNALRANQHLGGFLKRPMEFSLIQTVSFQLPNKRNATIITSFFEVEALLITRGTV